jgi:hypothetical protein
LFVEFCSPQQIGNSLVAFLSSEVVASITKVRLQKYSIKAEVFAEGKSCAIKLRVYSQESDGKYAVEVQRCAGDAFVLQSTFLLLTDFLQLHCGGVSVQGDAPAPLARPALPELEEDSEQDEDSAEVIAPLLMMATVAGLQAEAASALAAMVKEGRSSAAPLFEHPDQVATALTDLLATGCLNAVYPAARCVSDLAAFGEADLILAHHGLLPTMALQAVAELRTAKGFVGTALAQAVANAVQCCAGSLTLAVAKELRQVLDDALHDEVLKRNDVAFRHLEQAQLEAIQILV